MGIGMGGEKIGGGGVAGGGGGELGGWGWRKQGGGDEVRIRETWDKRRGWGGYEFRIGERDRGGVGSERSVGGRGGGDEREGGG